MFIDRYRVIDIFPYIKIHPGNQIEYKKKKDKKSQKFIWIPHIEQDRQY